MLIGKSVKNIWLVRLFFALNLFPYLYLHAFLFLSIKTTMYIYLKIITPERTVCHQTDINFKAWYNFNYHFFPPLGMIFRESESHTVMFFTFFFFSFSFHSPKPVIILIFSMTKNSDPV